MVGVSVCTGCPPSGGRGVTILLGGLGGRPSPHYLVPYQVRAVGIHWRVFLQVFDMWKSALACDSMRSRVKVCDFVCSCVDFEIHCCAAVGFVAHMLVRDNVCIILFARACVCCVHVNFWLFRVACV